VIETLPNKNSERPYRIELVDPEFTSICPMTGAPDFGTVTVRYVPGETLLELKSLRDFLSGYRSREILQEEVVNEVLDEVLRSAAPVYVEIEGVFNVRGGIAARVVARAGEDPGQ
jgi:7-cyano-7-deazaguanine reductase